MEMRIRVVNVPLLESTMTHIRDFPELHKQSAFFIETDCGTAGCFAGWACMLSGFPPWDLGEGSGHVCTPEGKPASAWDTAQDLLGLTVRQCETLFSPSNNRLMLELMVKDLTNNSELRDHDAYYDDVH